ncbi:MAG: aspartate/glutamate racemase family protein, partial [Paracoccaceae bacterium]
MRILCLNANTTEYVTQTVGDEMRATLGDNAEVIDATAAFGPAVIKTRLDHAVATHGVVDAAANNPDVDAIMLAVSFDTARDALREALSIPVVGMSEASVAMARMIGGRIGYVSMGADVTPLYYETLGHCDLDRDQAGWEALEAPSAYRPGDKTELDALLAGACTRLADKGADVVVL